MSEVDVVLACDSTQTCVDTHKLMYIGFFFITARC